MQMTISLVFPDSKCRTVVVLAISPVLALVVLVVVVLRPEPLPLAGR